MPLQKQNSNTMPSCFKQNKPLISRQPLNKNEIKNEFSVLKSNSKSELDLKKELKLCSQIWMKLSKLPLIKYLEKKHNPNVHLDTKVLNEITSIYEKINNEEYNGKDEFHSLVMDIINKFGLICKPTAQVYTDYNNLKTLFNSEWNKCLNIMNLNKECITSPNNKLNKINCSLCNEEFKSKKELKIHLKTCLINSQKNPIKDEGSSTSTATATINNTFSNNKPIIPHNSLSSPPPGLKYKYEKKDLQKNDKKELSISYKFYSKFFKPSFSMEAIKIEDSIECPFNSCNTTSQSLAKLVTHIMTNHQDKLMVISDYYCTICGKKLPDIVTQIIHCVEHQYNKRRKIFSKDHSTSMQTSTTSLLNPLHSLIPINTSLAQTAQLPLSSNKTLNTKSSKLKRKYPFSQENTKPNHLSSLDTNQNKKKETHIPPTPSPTSSLSNTLTSPIKNDNLLASELSKEQSKENDDSLNINVNVKEVERVKKLKPSDKDINSLLDKTKKNLSEKVQLQLGQSSDNILQLKNMANKTLKNNNKLIDEGKSKLNSIPSPISSPIQKKNKCSTKDNSIMSSPSPSQTKRDSSSSGVSYTRSKMRIPCVVESCKKTYRNIKGLKTHISRYHPEVNVNIEELVESYKVQSEQEELKKSKKVQNILPVTTSINNTTNISSSSNLLSVGNVNSLLKVSPDIMNIDKPPLSPNTLNSIIKGKISTTSNETEDDKKEKLISLNDSNSMNIDSSFDLSNNMNSKALISDTDNLNLLQNYLIENNNNDDDKNNKNNDTNNNDDKANISNSELENIQNIQNLNLSTNLFSYLDNGLNIPLNLHNPLLFNNLLSDTGNSATDILKNSSLISDLNKSDISSILSSQFQNSNDLLSNQQLLNLINNNSINNPTLALNLNNNLNLLNNSYNSVNPFSIYGHNAHLLNLLNNNTPLQYLNGTNNEHSNDININNTDSFLTTTNDTITTAAEDVSSSSSKESSTIKTPAVITTSSDDHRAITEKFSLTDQPSDTTNIDTDFLNNLFLNSNLSNTNLDLLNLNPSTSTDTKSLDLLSDLKDVDLKFSLNETLKKLKTDIPDENTKENEKDDNLTKQE